MKAYLHSIACAALDDDDPRGCTCSDNPTHPTTAAAGTATFPGSAAAGHFYDSLSVITEAAVESVFAADRRRIQAGLADFLARYPMEVDE